MDSTDIYALRELINQNRSLIWHTQSTENLDSSSIITAILNYGTWSDFQKLESILGKDLLKKSFQEITASNRSNLLPIVENYFSYYLDNHV